jgi:hypothetical protein
VQAADGGYVLAGHSGSYGFNNEDAIVIKTDGSGNVADELTYTSVSQIIVPSCSRTNSTIKVIIRNYGEKTVSSVPVTVNITGAATLTVNGTFSSSFPAEAIDTVTITNVNLSGSGNFTFNAYTNNSNDVYPVRNNLIVTRNLSPCVGIDELELSAFSVFPVPAKDLLFVELNDHNLKGIATLLDLWGRELDHQEFSSADRLTFTLHSLPDGIYFLRMTDTDGRAAVRRVVVTK